MNTSILLLFKKYSKLPSEFHESINKSRGKIIKTHYIIQEFRVSEFNCLILTIRVVALTIFCFLSFISFFFICIFWKFCPDGNLARHLAVISVSTYLSLWHLKKFLVQQINQLSRPRKVDDLRKIKQEERNRFCL